MRARNIFLPAAWDLSVACGDSSPGRGAFEKLHTAQTAPLEGEPLKSKRLRKSLCEAFINPTSRSQSLSAPPGSFRALYLHRGYHLRLRSPSQW